MDAMYSTQSQAPVHRVGQTKKFLRLPQVKDSTGLSRTSIYRKIAAHEFPRPIHIGQRSVAWVEADVLRWMEKQEQLSRDSQQSG
jgi:prophage regulatory protein